MESKELENLILASKNIFSDKDTEQNTTARSIKGADLASFNDYINPVGESLRFTGFETLAIRSGYSVSEHGEHCEAIYETSSYIYSSCEESYRKFSGLEEGNVYSRFTNPTVKTFETRLALLESGEDALAAASGMAAIMVTFLSLLYAGDKVVCSANVFGSTRILLKKYFCKLGIDACFVDLCDYKRWEKELSDPKTVLSFIESPANPTLEVANITQMAEMCQRYNCIFVVDNTVCTPCSQKPILLGANLVVHSTSKYIDGHGRCIGGCIVGSKELVAKCRGLMRCGGPAMTAHNAWIFCKGLETLELRFQKHSENAARCADWLETHPRVKQVIYPGLKSHPQHEIAKRQQKYFGGIVSFVIQGGIKEAWACLDKVKICSLTTNLGDAKTTITHPATTTHVKLSQEERDSIGVVDGLVRISLGLERVEDIIADLDHCLA